MRSGSVKPEKIKAVDDLANDMKNYGVVGIINLSKLPASALQKIKRDLGDNGKIKVVRKSILTYALEKANRNDLKKYIGAQPALILSKLNPFKLYRNVYGNSVSIAAKIGDVPLKDVEAKAGPTDLMPGPAITTLTKVGVPAKVEGGKIAVMKDKVILKAGKPVTPDLAAAMQLLKMKPMEIRLDVCALYEDNMIYTADVLSFDEVKFANDLTLAYQQAVNLSVNSGYPTKETIKIMIGKAFMSAKAVGLEAKVLDKGIIEELLGRAKLQAEILDAKIPK